MKKIFLFCFAFIIVSCDIPLVPGVHAAGDAVKPPKQDWSFSGMFGTFDKAALQRGLSVYRQVCASCHGLDRIYFRNLEALDYDEDQIKSIASEYTVIDGPNEEGEMFERPGKPSDTFVNPYPNKQASVYVNKAFPPDMSLLVRARANGPDYIYALLTGYKEEAPHGHHLLEGQYWNEYMPGHVIAMAPPLSDGMVAYEDGSDTTVEQYSKDVTHFLTWAAYPNMEARKRMGVKVLLFLLAFVLVMRAYKKKIWADVH